MQKKPLILALLAGMALSGAAQAALIDRGGGMIYDDDFNLTWLADANYAKTSGYDSDGIMNWAAANTWAAGLSFTDGVNTYGNWRLPTTLQPDTSCGNQSSGVSFGYNCTGSEMGHLFYSELGGVAGQSILSSSDPDLSKFTNLQAGNYWSATEYAPSTYGAWDFYFGYGFQYASYKDDGLYALAVSPGAVGATNGVPDDVAAVPEPATLLLVGLGLAGLGVMRRRG